MPAFILLTDNYEKEHVIKINSVITITESCGDYFIRLENIQEEIEINSKEFNLLINALGTLVIDLRQ